MKINWQRFLRIKMEETQEKPEKIISLHREIMESDAFR